MTCGDTPATGNCIEFHLIKLEVAAEVKDKITQEQAKTKTGEIETRTVSGNTGWEKRRHQAEKEAGQTKKT